MHTRHFPLLSVLSLFAVSSALSGCGPTGDGKPPAQGGIGSPGGTGSAATGSRSEEIRASLQSQRALDPFVPGGRSGDLATKPDSRSLGDNLTYSVLKDGSGEPPARDSEVKLHITGWIRIGNVLGKQFWNSRDDRKPHTYRLNRDDLIEGLVEVVGQMKKGERRWVLVPSELAYGQRGYPGLIPPAKDLVFDIELVDSSPPIGGFVGSLDR